MILLKRLMMLFCTSENTVNKNKSLTAGTIRDFGKSTTNIMGDVVTTQYYYITSSFKKKG